MSRNLARALLTLVMLSGALMFSSVRPVVAGPLGEVTTIPYGVDEPEKRRFIDAISPDGSLVLFEGDDANIFIWNRDDNSVERLDDATGQNVNNAVFGAGGAALYFVVGPASERQVYRWTADEGLEGLPIQDAYAVIFASSDGSSVLFQTQGDALVHWSVAGGTSVVAPQEPSWSYPGLSADGSTVGFGTQGQRGTVDLVRWNSGDSQKVATLATDYNFGGVEVSADGQTMAFNGVWEGNATVLRYTEAEGVVDIGGGISEAIGTMPDGQPYRDVLPEVVDMSDDGRTIAIANSCCAFRDDAPTHSFLWTESAGLSLLQAAARDQTSGLVLSADGMTVATVLGREITVWRQGRPTIIRTKDSGTDFGFTGAALSADGSTVASGYLEVPDELTFSYSNIEVWTEFGSQHTLQELIDSDAYDNGTDPEILRLYRAFFNREPDVAGAAYWLDIGDSTDSLTIAREFTVASPEFANTYANATNNGEFLLRVYDNVLGREPDPDGFLYWLDILNGTNVAGNNPDLGQLDRGTVVYYVALSTELVNAYPYLKP